MKEKPGVKHTRGSWAQTLSSGLEHRPYANADVCRADFQPWPCEVARLEVQVAQLRDVMSDCVVDGANVAADNTQLRAHLAQFRDALEEISKMDGANECGYIARLALADLPDAPKKGKL